MTVREHMKAAGYDPTTAWNADMLRPKAGTMECSKVEIKTFLCRPTCDEEMIGVEAIAVVPFTDGTDRPYPCGWDMTLESRIKAYFQIPKKSD